MAGHADGQRDAAAVEILGNVRGRSCRPCRDRCTRDSRYIAPGASAGSHTDPARIARLMVTAGIVRVSLAMTTTPFDSTARDGARPEPGSVRCEA